MIFAAINGFVFGAILGVVFVLSLFWGTVRRKMRQDIEEWERAKREHYSNQDNAAANNH